MLRITLFKGSFGLVNALNEAGIEYQSYAQRSLEPQASGQVIEIIGAISDAMPWNALAKVLIAWLNARASREVMITTANGEFVQAKGYSIAELQKLLQNAKNVQVVDTQPD